MALSRWNQKRSRKMAAMLRCGLRPEHFWEAYALCEIGCGQFKNEAQALWNIVRQIQPVRIAEIGRHLSGTSFLLACAARGLRRFLSVDVQSYPETDQALCDWLDLHGIEHGLVQADSRDYRPVEEVDFAYIDGGHTGEIVQADILAWKDRTRWIGFHDFADTVWPNGRRNLHRQYYPDVVRVIQEARNRYGWTPVGVRGRSEIVFRAK
jgi:hypothetical protein